MAYRNIRLRLYNKTKISDHITLTMTRVKDKLIGRQQDDSLMSVNSRPQVCSQVDL